MIANPTEFCRDRESPWLLGAGFDSVQPMVTTAQGQEGSSHTPINIHHAAPTLPAFRETLIANLVQGPERWPLILLSDAVGSVCIAVELPNS